MEEGLYDAVRYLDDDYYAYQLMGEEKYLQYIKDDAEKIISIINDMIGEKLQ